jgi:hypothetical protein
MIPGQFQGGVIHKLKKRPYPISLRGRLELHNGDHSFKGDPDGPQDLKGRTEIIPVKDSHTRINNIISRLVCGRYCAIYD